MQTLLESQKGNTPRHRVRELVCVYRPARDRDPTPSPDDLALTLRLRTAADVLGLTLLDYLIVGEEQRYYSFRETGLLGATPPTR